MSLATKCSQLPPAALGGAASCRDLFAPNLPPPCVYNYRSDIADIERRMLAWATSVGIVLRVTSRLRSCDEQLGLYLTNQTDERPSTSQHEFGAAFDVVPVSGWTRYGVSRAGAFEWCKQLALALGAGTALNEGNHVHVAWYEAVNWHRFIVARDVLVSIPIPSRPQKPRTLSPLAPLTALGLE